MSSKQGQTSSSKTAKDKAKAKDGRIDVDFALRIGVNAAESKDLKGSPPQARESGLLLDLRGRSFLAKSRANNATQSKQAAVKASKASSVSSKSSRSASSSNNEKRDKSPTQAIQGYAQNQQNTRTARPWQMQGDAATSVEVDYPEEPNDAGLQAGAAEAKFAKEQLLEWSAKTPSIAWASLQKEFSVQRLIWESLAFMKKAQAQQMKKGSSDALEQSPEEQLIADFESLFRLSNNDPDAAVKQLEDMLARDEKNDQLLSTSMIDLSRAAIQEEERTKLRRKLAEALDSAVTSADTAPQNQNMLDELVELVKSCAIGPRRTAYRIGRVLSWSVGAPRSGLVIPVSALWQAIGDEDEDPYIYYPPDPSVSLADSKSSDDRDLKGRRKNLNSLKVKASKKKDNNSPKKIGDAAQDSVPSPPPTPPPASRLPAFPRYSLSSPFSSLPLKIYPTGLAKDFNDEISTSAGDRRSVGSSATSGGSSEHRTKMFLRI